MSVVNRLPFHLDLQRAIIRTMMSDDLFLLKCNNHLKEEYFENKYLGWLYTLISNHFRLYKVCPSIEVVRNEILKFSIEERIAYEKVFDDVLNTAFKDMPYLINELTAFCQRAYFLDQLSSIETLYNKGTAHSAYEVMQGFGKTFQEINFDKEDTFDFQTLEKLFAEIRDSSRFRVPLGIRPIDEMLFGGIERGKMCVFLGGTNIGKSMILINIARNMMARNRKVLYLSLENDKSEDVCRFVASMTDIPTQKFKTEDLCQDEKVRVWEAKKVLQDKLILKHMHDSKLTLEKIENYCKMKYLMNPYDAIIIDYAQMIMHKSYDKMARDQAQGDVVRGLELLARDINVPLISVVQSNRAGLLKTQKSKGMNDLMRMTDIGESYAIMKHVDIVVTVTCSDEDQRNNRFRLLLDKNRGGDKGVVVEVETDYVCGKVFSPDLVCRKLETEVPDNEDSEENDGDDNVPF